MPLSLLHTFAFSYLLRLLIWVLSITKALKEEVWVCMWWSYTAFAYVLHILRVGAIPTYIEGMAYVHSVWNGYVIIASFWMCATPSVDLRWQQSFDKTEWRLQDTRSDQNGKIRGYCNLSSKYSCTSFTIMCIYIDQCNSISKHFCCMIWR